MNDSIVPERVVALSPLVRRITQNNPGLMTGPGTNTYIIGNEAVLIIDPGENTDEHFSAILSAVGKSQIVGIAPTHAHPDHWPLAPRLAEALSTITLGFKPHHGYVPARLVADGDILCGVEWALR